MFLFPDLLQSSKIVIFSSRSDTLETILEDVEIETNSSILYTENFVIVFLKQFEINIKYISFATDL